MKRASALQSIATSAVDAASPQIAPRAAPRRSPTIGLAIVAAAAAFAPSAWAADGSMAFSTPTEIGPIVSTTVTSIAMMQDQQISGCAVQAAFELPQTVPQRTADIRFALVRDARQPTGTSFVMSAKIIDRANQPVAVSAMSLATAAANTSRFSQPVARDDGRTDISGVFDALEGGTVMRDIMLSGADVSITTVSATALRLKIVGPVSSSTRSGYLQCAGDLFRPERLKGAP